MDTRTGEINTMEHFAQTLSKKEMQDFIVPVFKRESTPPMYTTIKDSNGDCNVPQKYRKKVRSGRWEYVMKGEYFVAVVRKSNGEEIFFNQEIKESPKQRGRRARW